MSEEKRLLAKIYELHAEWKANPMAFADSYPHIKINFGASMAEVRGWGARRFDSMIPASPNGDALDSIAAHVMRPAGYEHQILHALDGSAMVVVTGREGRG